jgi:hypothetical protein
MHVVMYAAVDPGDVATRNPTASAEGWVKAGVKAVKASCSLAAAAAAAVAAVV